MVGLIPVRVNRRPLSIWQYSVWWIQRYTYPCTSDELLHSMTLHVKYNSVQEKGLKEGVIALETTIHPLWRRFWYLCVFSGTGTTMHLVEHGSEGSLWVVLSPILPKWFTHQDTNTHQNQHLNPHPRSRRNLGHGRINCHPDQHLIMKLAA